MPPDVMGKGIPLTGIFDENHPRYAEAGEIRALYEKTQTSSRSSTPRSASKG